MLHKHLLLVILLTGPFILGGGGGPPQIATVCPGAPSPFPPGIPTIPPRNDCTPSFTAQDVQEYVSHVHDGMGDFNFVGQPTIVHIWFITNTDAAKLTDEAPSNFGPRATCYVELTGTFIDLSGHPLLDGPAPNPVFHGHIIFIFDAHTGNMLEDGGRR